MIDTKDFRDCGTHVSLMMKVIEPRWHEFETKLRGVTTIDQVLSLHKDFQDTFLKECLLTKQELLKVGWTLLCFRAEADVALLTSLFVGADKTDDCLLKFCQRSGEVHSAVFY